jgi:hypothetical protein
MKIKEQAIRSNLVMGVLFNALLRKQGTLQRQTGRIVILMKNSLTKQILRLTHSGRDKDNLHHLCLKLKTILNSSQSQRNTLTWIMFMRKRE